MSVVPAVGCKMASQRCARRVVRRITMARPALVLSPVFNAVDLTQLSQKTATATFSRGKYSPSGPRRKFILPMQNVEFLLRIYVQELLMQLCFSLFLIDVNSAKRLLQCTKWLSHNLFPLQMLLLLLLCHLSLLRCQRSSLRPLLLWPSHHKRSRSEEFLEEILLPKARSSIPSGGSRKSPCLLRPSLLLQCRFRPLFLPRCRLWPSLSSRCRPRPSLLPR